MSWKTDGLRPASGPWNCCISPPLLGAEVDGEEPSVLEELDHLGLRVDVVT